MQPIKKMMTIAAIAGLGAATWGVGTSLVKDVQFAHASEDVAAARQDLATVGDVSSVYKAVNHAMERSVVHIVVAKNTPHAAAGPSPQDLFKFFGPNGEGMPPQLRQRLHPTPQPDPNNDDNNGDGEQPQEAEPKEVATGSGCIMDVSNGEGYIVTNNHVVADASKVDVVLSDGRRVENATVVATDPKSDVAVVKIKADRLIAAKWGDSDQLEKGDIVVAFGSPFGFVGSMSHGIVSALNRDQVNINENRQGFAYENFIQVDAAINPGNSGGPLCNVHGEVVGINTAIASRSGSFSGIGFAIPSDQAKTVYDALKTQGKVVRGYLGVKIFDINSDKPEAKSDVENVGFKGDTGIYVKEVQADGPAIDVLQPGDVITEMDGKPLKSMTELRTKIANDQPGTPIKLTVWRDKAFQAVTVKLGTQPEGDVAMAGQDQHGAPAKPQQVGGLGLSFTTPTAEDLQGVGLPATAKGVLVQEVRNGSPASLYGINPGDLIVRIGGAPVTTADEAKAALAKADLSKGLRIDLRNREGLRMVIVSKKPTR